MGKRYRVCQYAEGQETRLALCEVRIEEDGTTTRLRVASTLVFTTVEDLKRGLEQMRAGCELPVLTITRLSDDFDGSGEAIGPTDGPSRDKMSHIALERSRDTRKHQRLKV